MNYLKLTKETLFMHLITDLVSSDSGKAISMFMGTTEESVDYDSSVTLEYEANESAAVKALENLCEEIRVKWPHTQNIAVYHRLGLVPAKEASIIIGISSPNREDAIEATRWFINNIKKSVPIWKREIYADSWTENEKVNLRKVAKKIKLVQSADGSRVSPYSRQIQVTSTELDQRISRYVKLSRDEVDINNVKEFHTGYENSSFTCVRVAATVQKRKDSKSHLQVNRVFSCFQIRDQNNSDYLTKFAPTDGVEERLHGIECQLSLATPVSKNIYSRLAAVEKRLLVMETTSPDHILFWEKMKLPTVRGKPKKVVISTDNIDELLMQTEARTRCTSYQRTWN